MGGYAPKYIAKIYFLEAMLKGWVALLRKNCTISYIFAPFSMKRLAFWVAILRNGGRFSGWICSEFTTKQAAQLSLWAAQLALCHYQIF